MFSLAYELMQRRNAWRLELELSCSDDVNPFTWKWNKAHVKMMWKGKRAISLIYGDVNPNQSSRQSLIGACVVWWALLSNLWPSHGSALLQTLVCCHFNQTVTPSKFTQIHLAGSYLDGEASKRGMGGALPRWRPPPHPIYENSTFLMGIALQVWRQIGIRLGVKSIGSQSLLIWFRVVGCWFFV